MSSTHRGGQRSPADFYQTPPWVVHRLLDALDLTIDFGPHWLDPCSGHGAIVKAVQEWSKASLVEKWTMVELEKDRLPHLIDVSNLIGVKMDLHAPIDFFDWLRVQKETFDVTIMNPAFSLAQSFIEECIKISTHVFALERLNFVEGEERYKLMIENKPDLYILPQRPTFYLPDGTPVLGKNGSPATDSITYAWFHFWPGSTGKWRMLGLTPKEIRKAKRLL